MKGANVDIQDSFASSQHDSWRSVGCDVMKQQHADAVRLNPFSEQIIYLSHSLKLAFIISRNLFDIKYLKKSVVSELNFIFSYLYTKQHLIPYPSPNIGPLSDIK